MFPLIFRTAGFIRRLHVSRIPKSENRKRWFCTSQIRSVLFPRREGDPWSINPRKRNWFHWLDGVDAPDGPRTAEFVGNFWDFYGLLISNSTGNLHSIAAKTTQKHHRWSLKYSCTESMARYSSLETFSNSGHKILVHVSFCWADILWWKDLSILTFSGDFSEMLKSEKATNNIVFGSPGSPVA